MPDNTSNRGGQDRRRINVSQDHELRDWSEKYGVSPERLMEAVAVVGEQADKVEHATYAAPSGWKSIAGGFQRADASGVGQIRLIAGHAATKRTVADEFAAMWRARVVPA